MVVVVVGGGVGLHPKDEVGGSSPHGVLGIPVPPYG